MCTRTWSERKSGVKRREKGMTWRLETQMSVEINLLRSEGNVVALFYQASLLRVKFRIENGCGQ